MNAAKAFIDSNVVLYLFSADSGKADRAESVIASDAIISVQVLNEVANVLRRKSGMSWKQTSEALRLIRELCSTVPLTIETHDQGRRIAERYGHSVYDAMIVASALLAGCKTLYSEDMQDGLVIDQQLRILNPFSGSSESD